MTSPQHESETSNPQAFRVRVRAYFEARPLVWIDAHVLAKIGGAFASRTRISEVRREMHKEGSGTIENRTRRQTDGAGRRWTTSEYRYVPTTASTPTSGDLADLNSWSLR